MDKHNLNCNTCIYVYILLLNSSGLEYLDELVIVVCLWFAPNNHAALKYAHEPRDKFILFIVGLHTLDIALCWK